MRALSPRSIAAYEATLALAFPEGDYTPAGLNVARVKDWGNSALNQLKCALRWWKKSHGLPPKDPVLEDLLQPKYVIDRQVYHPTEAEIEQLEKATDGLLPHERASILLLLYLGFRAEEFYTLKREQIQKALSKSVLTFVRKGGREDTIDILGVGGLFQTLLNTPAKSIDARKRNWETVGQIFSTGVPMSQYHVIRRLVRKCFKTAGLPEMSPHKLRHAFATRMVRDGANTFIVQKALNHKNISTTQRYVHASTEDVAKYLRREVK